MDRIKQWISRILSWFIYKMREHLPSIVTFFGRLLPLSNSILLESAPDLADNTYALYEELIRQGYNKKYRIIWITEKDVLDCDLPENVSFCPRFKDSRTICVRVPWLVARAKFIIDCNNFLDKTNPRTVRVHLTHGIPIKACADYCSMIRDVDLITTTAAHWIPLSAQMFSVPESTVKALGFPRNDVLVPRAHEKKAVIWMPTYRVHKNHVASHMEESDIYADRMPFGLPCIENFEALERVNALFRAHGATLYIRLHPAQDLSAIRLDSLSDICICDDDFLHAQGKTLYELLAQTDALVSDYSSVYFDYLLLDKPIAMIVTDFDIYCKYAGLLVDDYAAYQEAYPAQYIESFDALMDFFRDVLQGADPMAAQRRAVCRTYMDAQNGHTAATITEYMRTQYGL